MLLASAAAGLGVAIALALPAVSWFNATRQAPTPALPNTAMKPAGPTASVAPTPPAQTALTPAATPTPDENSPQASGPAAEPAPSVGDPAATVARFYQDVSAHEFAAAAALWTPRMQAQYPPAVYIDHRFAATQQINLRGARMLGDHGGHAIVYVDVVEVIDGQRRQWVGTWQVVRTASGWLLNRPNLRAAS